MSTDTILKAAHTLVDELDTHGPNEIQRAAKQLKEDSNDFALPAWKRKQYARLAKLMKEAFA